MFISREFWPYDGRTFKRMDSMTPFNYFMWPVREMAKSNSVDEEAGSSTNSEARDEAYLPLAAGYNPATDTSSFSMSPDGDPKIAHLLPGSPEPSTEKVVASLSYGDAENHAYNIWRHLKGPSNSEDQVQVDSLLDGLDILSARDKSAYCRLVQKLAERILPYCLQCIEEYAPTSPKDFSVKVPLDQKIYNVVRLVWIMCLYSPALNRIANSSSVLFPSLNYMLGACHKRIRMLCGAASDTSNSGGDSRNASLGGIPDSSLSEDNLYGFMVSILSILYNSLYTSKGGDIALIAHEQGVLKTVALVLRRTRNVTIGETCLRIMDIAADYGGVAIQTVLRDLQVMREASNLWQYMLKKNMVTKTGFHVADLISRLGETLRQSARGYAGGSGLGLAQSKCGCKEPLIRRLPLFRNPTLTNVNHWCSSPLCGGSEEVAGRKFRLCARCRLCMYCSEGCQEFHWNQCHRTECRPWVEHIHNDKSDMNQHMQERISSTSDSVFTK